MPFVSVSIGKKVAPEQKQELAEQIARLITIIPGKPYEKTMVRIDDDCTIYRAGERTECAFMETRLYKESDLESKVEYTEKLYALFERVLGIPQAQAYFNILELDHWGSRGSFR